MSNTFVPSVKKRQIMELAESGKRIDGRSLMDYRPLSIQVGVVEKAEGSAAVRLGDTYVIGGVKIEQETRPFPDTPDEGTMMVNSEFVPMASPEFEPGPPSSESIELSRVVDRGLRESKLIDTKKMCIHEGKLVWTTFVDIFILDHCGNLIDASALAASCAILNAKMPELETTDSKRDATNIVVELSTPQKGWREMELTSSETRTISLDRKKNPLPLRAIPVAVTMAKIGNLFFVDPSKEEEEVMDCRITVTFTDDNNICAMQKGGSGPLTMDEIRHAVEIAKTKSQELRKLLPIPEDVQKIIEKSKNKDKDKS